MTHLQTVAPVGKKPDGGGSTGIAYRGAEPQAKRSPKGRGVVPGAASIASQATADLSGRCTTDRANATARLQPARSQRYRDDHRLRPGLVVLCLLLRRSPTSNNRPINYRERQDDENREIHQRGHAMSTRHTTLPPALAAFIIANAQVEELQKQVARLEGIEAKHLEQYEQAQVATRHARAALNRAVVARFPLIEPAERAAVKAEGGV